MWLCSIIVHLSTTTTTKLNESFQYLLKIKKLWTENSTMMIWWFGACMSEESQRNGKNDIREKIWRIYLQWTLVKPPANMYFTRCANWMESHAQRLHCTISHNDFIFETKTKKCLHDKLICNDIGNIVSLFLFFFNNTTKQTNKYKNKQ